MAVIYCIKNKLNCKCYIGSTHNSPFGRWQAHVGDLNSGKHHSKKFQQEWGMTRLDDWEFIILESDIPSGDKHAREQFWFERFAPELNGTSKISRMINKKKCVEIASSMLLDGRPYREIQKACGCSLGWITSLKHKSTLWSQNTQ